MNKVTVLLDKRANNLSICTIDDTTSEEVETTLSVAEAWALVADINEALQKLALAAETRVQIVGNAKINKEQLDELGKALEKSNKAFSLNPEAKYTREHVDHLLQTGEIGEKRAQEMIREVAAQVTPVIKVGGGAYCTVNVDARGASPEQTEAAVHRVIAKNGPAYPAHINVDARSTNPVPKSTHRPYSGTMNT